VIGMNAKTNFLEKEGSIFEYIISVDLNNRADFFDGK